MALPLNHAVYQLLKRFHFEMREFEFKGSPVYVLEGGNKKAPTVALMPGFGDTIYSWGLQLIRLSRTHRVLALDPPGYTGFSPKPKGGPLSFEDQEKAAEIFLTQIVGKADYLIGNSLGGWISFRLAQKHPDRVGHLIAVNAGGCYTTDEEYLSILGLYEIHSYSDFLRLVRKLWHRVPLYFYPISAIALYPLMKSPEFAHVVRSIEHHHFLNDALKNFKMPVSLVWGKQDGLFNEAMGRKMASLLPKVNLHLIDNCGHLPHLEQRRTFHRVLDEIMGMKPKKKLVPALLSVLLKPASPG